MTELHTEHCVVEEGPSGITLMPEYVRYLQNHGYNIEYVRNAYAVPSESRDVLHLVVEIEVLSRPISHPELDVSTDGTELYVCGCESFRYQQSADVSEDGTHPEDCGTCKHIKQIDKVARARADDAQVTL